MNETKFKLLSMVALFLAVFAWKSIAEEPVLESTEEVIEMQQTEMDRAIQVAQEIQALNNGEFSSQSGPFHPDQHPRLDVKTLSLSVNTK